MITRMADSKGRITLGKKFARKTFLVEENNENEIKLQLTRVIPESEAWLYKNLDAKESVLRGLEQARARRFSESPPDLVGDQALVDEIENQ
jgi:hypothetical protein